MITDLLEYGARVSPGLLLLSTCWVLTRRGTEPLLRVVMLILGFVLIRDAMTPVGFWRLGTVEGVPWLRLTDEVGILLLFAVGSLALTVSVLRLDHSLRDLVRWGRFDLTTIALGIGGGALAAAPGLLLSSTTPLPERGGAVAVALLPALLFFALAGNFAEEVLFRGFLQGHLEQTFSAVRSAVLSGLLFGACHAFLASTVTDIGLLLVLFTVYEGLICAFLRMSRGVIPAALTHGLAIFLLIMPNSA